LSAFAGSPWPHGPGQAQLVQAPFQFSGTKPGNWPVIAVEMKELQTVEQGRIFTAHPPTR